VTKLRSDETGSDYEDEEREKKFLRFGMGWNGSSWPDLLRTERICRKKAQKAQKGNWNRGDMSAVARDRFATGSRNFQLTTTNSYSHETACSWSALNYGDYSGLAFHAGYFFPTWCSYANTVIPVEIYTPVK
jgi:hypothetical protein